MQATDRPTRSRRKRRKRHSRDSASAGAAGTVADALRRDHPPDTGAKAAPEAVEDKRLDELATKLRLRFRDPDLLRLALTHRSVVHDLIAAGGDTVTAAARTNERLEFLGDAVLGAIVAEYLYVLDPFADEGKLTQRRVALVRAETLVRWARELDLGAYLYLGQGEQPSESARDRMLAGAFEALIGAIALDSGPRTARRFLSRFLARDAAEIIARAEGIENPKGRLQELLHDRFKSTPTYRVVASRGPQHAKEFTVEVSLRDRMLGVGSGPSKREAEQQAAAAALDLLAAELSPQQSVT